MIFCCESCAWCIMGNKCLTSLFGADVLVAFRPTVQVLVGHGSPEEMGAIPCVSKVLELFFVVFYIALVFLVIQIPGVQEPTTATNLLD